MARHVPGTCKSVPSQVISVFLPFTALNASVAGAAVVPTIVIMMRRTPRIAVVAPASGAAAEVTKRRDALMDPTSVPRYQVQEPLGTFVKGSRVIATESGD